jgi:hypothetical protein
VSYASLKTKLNNQTTKKNIKIKYNTFKKKNRLGFGPWGWPNHSHGPFPTGRATPTRPKKIKKLFREMALEGDQNHPHFALWSRPSFFLFFFLKFFSKFFF